MQPSSINSSVLEVDPTIKKPVGSESWVPSPLLDSRVAASIMGIHEKTLQRYAREKIVRGIRVGKLWRFRGADIEDWIQRQAAS
jgi:excisionase family DNA binding protein